VGGACEVGCVLHILSLQQKSGIIHT
jgi:hypothetical protein